MISPYFIQRYILALRAINTDISREKGWGFSTVRNASIWIAITDVAGTLFFFINNSWLLNLDHAEFTP